MNGIFGNNEHHDTGVFFRIWSLVFNFFILNNKTHDLTVLEKYQFFTFIEISVL